AEKIVSRKIVADASFCVESGSVLGILGESGSGKTLIALTLAGLLAGGVIVHHGVLRFNNQRIDLAKRRGLDKLRGHGILLIPQSSSGALHPYRSLRGQIKEANRKADVQHLLSTVGIDPLHASSRPNQLSGGMKQRALLAVALAIKPHLMILDEPTEGLDPATKWDMLLTLGSLIKSLETAVILITHDIESLAALEEILGRSRVRTALLYNKTINTFANVGELTKFIENTYQFPELCHESTGHNRGTELMEAHPRSVAVHDAGIRRTSLFSSTFQSVPARERNQNENKLLELNSVTKRYPAGLKALDGISLYLNSGENGGLIGKSGAGKSTLLKCIAGIEPLTAGKIVRKTNKIQLLWQDPYISLNPYLTAKEIILDPARKTTQVDRINKIVEMLELDEEILSKHPWELSGGQCQKVALARALTPLPHILLADEPFSGLFPPARRKLVKVLKHFCYEEGITLFVASHNFEVIKDLTDRLWVLEKGKIIEEGPTDNILLHPAHPETGAIIEAASRFTKLLS
ncbi:MAG: ABC transporter ATP-binding protein, partial [Thermodesulforhabdaceae bacterium]